MKDGIWIMIFILTLLGVILLDKWLLESVMASGLPDWVKYMILK